MDSRAEAGGSRSNGEKTRLTDRSLGVPLAMIIVAAWVAHLVYVLAALEITPTAWGITRVALHMIVQAYLYTGLFITSHDAMHGSVTRNRKLNLWIGRIAVYLFAAFSYRKLHRNHMKHHRWPGEEQDPDFYHKSQNFFIWFGAFFLHYFSLIQFINMAVIFNLLILVAPTANVILFWIAPAFLGTFQLFYFGTYRPHMFPHTDAMDPHKARSQKKNHLLAMITCYFFGYHHEHHDSPGTPWWRLYRLK